MTPTPYASTVTAADLAAALRLIDRALYVNRKASTLTDVLAAARAAVAYEHASTVYLADDAPWTGDARAEVHKALDDAHTAKVAAVAALCALAKGVEA